MRLAWREIRDRFRIMCIDGPCSAKSLEPIAVTEIDGDICLCGVKLAEDDGIPDPFTYVEEDNIPEVLI